MKKKMSVLIIEDHPFSANAYRKAINDVAIELVDLEFDFSMAKDCDSANMKIMDAVVGNGLDIVLLDMNLPESKDGKIRTGEDLGIKIRRKLPKAKIIVCTTYYDNLRIQSILKSLDPDGFLVKNDFNLNELRTCIKKVITEPPYYSITVLKSFRKQVANGHKIDEIDRMLLYELSIGTKMNELPNVLPLSMTGIERRKRHLKEIFDLKKGSDRELVILAKEKGFI
jgi:DNA-binding NarL/FixJ family response regulator|tara:strand:- start:110 stop:787 length:678 start_codon:yes stop_codon:yes gene_type:complete